MIRTMFKLLLPVLLAALHVGAGAATCTAELGAERADILAKQCLKVAPAMRPACNVANSCQRIEAEIQRACYEYGRQAPFCRTEAKDGTFEGYLVGAGGIDNYSVVVRRDDGNRVFAYCDDNCDALLTENANNPDLSELKPTYQGKRVTITVRTERSNGRVFGSEPDDRAPFAKAIKFVK
jgi:hypothetical protein